MMENQPAPTSIQKKAVLDPLVGAVLDTRFDIESIIGRGSTSTVYKARDRNSGQAVAIKMLHAHLAFDDGLVARFEREAQAAKILSHHNIAAISDYAVTDKGTPYLVEEFVLGESLQQILNRRGQLGIKQATEIFIQICAGLAAAHECGIVHRDLKPANIMVDFQAPGDMDSPAQIKILDFGCAKTVVELGETVLRKTQTGEMLGSLLYMSPEQCLDGQIDGRSDIYALGCVLYETVTGKAPLAARTAFETMNKQLATMPESLQHARPDLHFSKGLEAIIFRAMAKSPAQRYQKITEMMDDLIAVRENRTATAMEVHARPVAQLGGEKHPIKKAIQIAFWLYCITGFLGLVAAFFTTMPTAPTQIMIYVLAIAGFLIAGISAYFKSFDKNSALEPSKTVTLIDGRELTGWDINHELFIQLGYTKSFNSSTVLVFGASSLDGKALRVKVGWPHRPPAFLNVAPVKEESKFWGALCLGNSSYLKEDTGIACKGAIVELEDATYLYINSHLAKVITREE
jgi:serine/threonine protein kinase